jgi:hypothetical protein
VTVPEPERHDPWNHGAILNGRHPATAHLARMLMPNPNLPEPLAQIARGCEALAADMVWELPDGPELTAGLRKLLEAKDCFVRAGLR